MSRSRWTAFLERLADAQRAALDDDSIGAALDVALDVARAEWPGLPLADDTFFAALARHLPAELSCVEGVAGYNAPDLFLATACAGRVPGAAEAFSARYLHNVPALIRGVTTDPAIADEVRQVLGEKLLVGVAGGAPRISDYAGRGALLNWVRVAATRAALDLVRANAARAGDAREPEAIDEAVAASARDPELDFIRGRYRDDFKRAMEDALRALPIEQRNLLRMHLLEGLSIDEIGALFRLHRATAARRLVTARAAVLDGTRALLRERLRLSPSEFDSIADQVRSQLDLSLSGILKEN